MICSNPDTSDISAASFGIPADDAADVICSNPDTSDISAASFGIPADGAADVIYSPKTGSNLPGCASIDTDESGFVITGEECATNIPGIFAAGDCRAKNVRHLTTAVGDGATAALSACDYLQRFCLPDLKS